MPIQNTTGGKTFPKRGRLGSGAYFPKGVPIAVNVFGPNTDVPTSSAPLTAREFGSPSNAGNNTQFGQNRAHAGTGLDHPNAGFKNMTQQNYVAPFTISGTGKHESPFGASPVVQPHERNSFRHKLRKNYHTVSGASRTTVADTAFHRVPPKRAPHPPTPPAVQVLRVPRVQVASFFSRNNLWVDPNNSFLHGKTNVSGDVGRGRWTTTKKGAAG